MLAREIENETVPGLQGGLDDVTLLEGPFAGIDDDGNWIVGGLGVAVDSVTGLEGSPSVGHRVAVDAVVRDGRLVARNVSAIQRDEDVTVREVRVRGTVDRVLRDGTIVVDGVRVTLSNLTELAIEPVPGDAIEIKALLHTDGTLVAKLIDAAPPEAETGETRANPVDIEGKIQRVTSDGSLIVNGIQVVTGALSELEGDIQPGATVQIRGILQRNGTVLARDIRGQGRRFTEGETEARVEGVVERVFLDDDGNVGSFVVDGVTVAIEDLTTSNVVISPGTSVVVQTIVKDGLFLAVTVEPKAAGGATQRPEVEVQGTIEAIERDATGKVVGIIINGLEVEVGPSSRIQGELEIGEAVELKGVISGGGLVADEVEGENPGLSGDRPSKFKLGGVIEEVRRDGDSNVVSLIVDGERISVEGLTLIQGELVPGQRVVVEGIVRNGALLAATIVEDTSGVEDTLDDSLSTGEEESKS